MPEKLSTLSPSDAWQPLPASQWDESAARHLLQRVGFNATAAETARALKDGPAATLQRYFAQMPGFPRPRMVADLEVDGPDMYRKMNNGDAAQKRLAQQDARERSREALFDMSLKWLQQASRPDYSPAEKWLLFLSDVWVVSVEKVKNSSLLFEHQDIIRHFALGTGPNLAKAMSRSPAMVVYLDLQQSQKDAPNENFARELFELFTLGEGNYTEDDIKQAARAFTGYRQRGGEFSFVRRQHDEGRKTVFGSTGPYTGDDVIDLVYRKKAASTFLPKEMVRFYLSDDPLPVEFTDTLGTAWAQSGFDLRRLVLTFFGSRAFFAEDLRGNFIKSPIQFYLGLLQNLDLNVIPIPRQVITSLRQMGQMPFDPPNVRGWVGGRSWINSATLTARRQLVQNLLQPINENALNADDQLALTAAYSNGIENFTVDPDQFKTWAKLSPSEAANQILARSLPGKAHGDLAPRVEKFLQQGTNRPEATMRAALATLLESPEYQLC